MTAEGGGRRWLAPWLVTIVVTGALMALSGLFVGWLQTWYAAFIFVGATSIWAAWDSARLQVRRYRTQMANEPVLILFMCFTIWIIAFPWYLVIREGIRRGLVPLKQPPSPVQPADPAPAPPKQ